MSALFSFESTLVVVLLAICTATFLREKYPSLYHRDSQELHYKFLYKCSVIGDRLSPWVAIACVIMAVRIIFIL